LEIAVKKSFIASVPSILISLITLALQYAFF